jgi:hypothetical protein
VQILNRTDPGFATELARLQEVLRAIDSLGADLRQDLQAPVDPQLAAVVTAALRKHMAAAIPMVEPAHRSARWRLTTLAALVLAALVGTWVAVAGGDAPQRLDGEIRIRAMPDGGLHFDFGLPPEGQYEVRVQSGETLLLSTTKVTGTDWRPAQEVVAQWPAVVTVRVEARLRDGTKLADGELQWTPKR